MGFHQQRYKETRKRHLLFRKLKVRGCSRIKYRYNLLNERIELIIGSKKNLGKPQDLGIISY